MKRLISLILAAQLLLFCSLATNTEDEPFNPARADKIARELWREQRLESVPEGSDIENHSGSDDYKSVTFEYKAAMGVWSEKIEFFVLGQGRSKNGESFAVTYSVISDPDGGYKIANAIIDRVLSDAEIAKRTDNKELYTRAKNGDKSALNALGEWFALNYLEYVQELPDFTSHKELDEREIYSYIGHTMPDRMSYFSGAYIPVGIFTERAKMFFAGYEFDAAKCDWIKNGYATFVYGKDPPLYKYYDAKIENGVVYVRMLMEMDAQGKFDNPVITTVAFEKTETGFNMLSKKSTAYIAPSPTSAVITEAAPTSAAVTKAGKDDTPAGGGSWTLLITLTAGIGVIIAGFLIWYFYNIKRNK